MGANNNEFTLMVNGKKVDRSKLEHLFSEANNTKKTIVDQTNPLLERATRILAEMQ